MALLARYGPEAAGAMGEIREGDLGMNMAACAPTVVLDGIGMRPGATIHLHDHRHHKGATMRVEGTFRCRNFDIAPRRTASSTSPPVWSRRRGRT